MKLHNYYTYITTNVMRKVLYIGVTNDLQRRINEHYNLSYPGFSQKYKCKYLVYYEFFTDINDAIKREKEIKGWRREKKNKLVSRFNPQWKFLNDRFRTDLR